MQAKPDQPGGEHSQREGQSSTGTHGSWFPSSCSCIWRGGWTPLSFCVLQGKEAKNRILLSTPNQCFGLALDFEWHRNQILDKEETFLLPCRAGNGVLVLGFLFWVCGRVTISCFFFSPLSSYIKKIYLMPWLFGDSSKFQYLNSNAASFSGSGKDQFESEFV